MVTWIEEREKSNKGFFYMLSVGLLLTLIVAILIVSFRKDEASVAEDVTATSVTVPAKEDSSSLLGSSQVNPPVSSTLLARTSVDEEVVSDTRQVVQPSGKSTSGASKTPPTIASKKTPVTIVATTSPPTTHSPAEAKLQEGDIALVAGEQGSITIEGSVNKCEALKDLHFYYVVNDQESVKSIDCSAGDAAVSLPITGVNISETVQVTAGIRSALYPAADSSVSLELASEYESEFPAVPENSGTGRRIVYDNPGQRVWLVEDNEFVYDSYLVSGKKDTPLPGTYSVFSKSLKAYSDAEALREGRIDESIYMSHMVRFVRPDPAIEGDLATGFHGIPVDPLQNLPLQTEAELGKFRSSGCIRQNNHTAEKLYNWASVGTTVVVL